MSDITFNRGEIIFHDVANQPCSLIDLTKPAANQSDLLQSILINEVGEALQKFFNNTSEGTVIDTIIFLRIVARLMRKPQVHNVLHIGEWSPLDEVLAKLLPQFNEKNSLWFYSSTRSVKKFEHVNLVFVDGDGYFMPANQFDTIVFDRQTLPTIELLLAVKDYGKIYFVAQKSLIYDFWKEFAQTLDLDKNFSIIELELLPSFKQELYCRSPQGQLDAKKAQIKQTVFKFRDVVKKFNELPPQEKNAYLDECIDEITRTEKILNEIFLQLHSNTIKLNFNMFKEFLIDFRMYTDPRLKACVVEDLNRQIDILKQDLDNI